MPGRVPAPRGAEPNYTNMSGTDTDPPEDRRRDAAVLIVFLPFLSRGPLENVQQDPDRVLDAD